LEPTGEVLFAEFMELSGDLRDGVIADLRAILQDGSLVAASGGRRTGGNLLNMQNAVYSPCKLCEEDPSRAPLWQIKAVRIVHDKKRQTIEYKDAWLEIAGVPVMYTPYISHPDPSVKKKSGFLTPSFGTSTLNGASFTAPYYYNISSNSDATLTPNFTTNKGVVMGGEYRQIIELTLQKKVFLASGGISLQKGALIMTRLGAGALMLTVSRIRPTCHALALKRTTRGQKS
jgi:LPS-assembly protein